MSDVPHFPRISAADRADGSVEILAQGESHVFSPQPGRGAEDARMRALAHLHEIALGLGRPIRVTTWTLARERASIVVTPAGECYDEARPHSSFVIAAGRPGPTFSPAPDIPAAVRPWGLDLRPASPLAAAGTTSPPSHRTRWVVAAALAMLLLWSGVVAVLLTTGHQNAAVADPDARTSPSATPTASSTPSPSVSPRPTAAAHHLTATPSSTPVPPPVITVTALTPGLIQIAISRTGATAAHPLAMRVRVDPDTGAVFHRLVHLTAATQSIKVGNLSSGSARWVVLIPGSRMQIGRVVVHASVHVKHPTTTTPTPTPTPTTPTVPPSNPPSGAHHVTHHHATHHHATHHHPTHTTTPVHHHHHGPASNPSNPSNPIPDRAAPRA